MNYEPPIVSYDEYACNKPDELAVARARIAALESRLRRVRRVYWVIVCNGGTQCNYPAHRDERAAAWDVARRERSFHGRAVKVIRVTVFAKEK